MPTHEASDPLRRRLPRLRRADPDTLPSRRLAGPGTIGMIVAFAALILLISQLFFSSDGRVNSDVIDFSRSLEQIQELSTIRSHLRFGVVVREESGNIVVRRLADQTEFIGMEDLGSALFQDPTMFVELHGVATYGVRLDNLDRRVRQDDSTVTIQMPRAELLDVKLVTTDTRIVARMKGLFRGSNTELLLEAQRNGERFTREFAEQDTALLDLAQQRAREALSLLAQGAGKRVRFE